MRVGTKSSMEAASIFFHFQPFSPNCAFLPQSRSGVLEKYNYHADDDSDAGGGVDERVENSM